MPAPAKPALIRKSVTLPEPLWDAVAAYRAEEMLGTEAEAVRRLLLLGLASGKAARGRKA